MLPIEPLVVAHDRALATLVVLDQALLEVLLQGVDRLVHTVDGEIHELVAERNQAEGVAACVERPTRSCACACGMKGETLHPEDRRVALDLDLVGPADP